MATPFGDRIRELREGRALTARVVAERLGIARATLYAWEAGDHQPDAAPLAALIALYGCDEATELRLWRLRAGSEAPAEVAA